MTLPNHSFEDASTVTTDIKDGSTNLASLYCSHLWSNSYLRNAIINAPYEKSKMIKYCYTCRGKIRKYELKPSRDDFLPNNHSTPKLRIDMIEPPLNELRDNVVNDVYGAVCSHDRNSSKDCESTDIEIQRCIPSMSRQIDSSFRQKYISYDMHPNEINQRRLRKSLKGIGCIVNFALTDSSVKKRTQIQACSISVMIIAIVVISFVLVNFTTSNFTHSINETSTIVVPTENIHIDETSSAIRNTFTDLPLAMDMNTMEYESSTQYLITISTENSTQVSIIMSKIRKNIRTYTKGSSKNHDSAKPKDIINRDVSQSFCSCQKNEICMLDENSGTAVCKQPTDNDDPTGCGGLCALETEACQLVDKARGVRVCRLVSLVTCSPHEWRCRNGLCVPAGARCDGSIQCYDRSDEVHCECDLTKQFRCGHSISCFSNTNLCDGIIDCWDGYDEINCTTECPRDQFTCTNSQCILSSRFCDGLADCADGSDEPHGCDGNCGAHEMRCMNRRCVSRTNLCDGHDDCGDSTDELHCSQLLTHSP